MMDENQVFHSIVGDAKQSWAEKSVDYFYFIMKQ